MKPDRPKLPKSYLQLDLPGRLAYVEREMRELDALQDLLAEMRTEENHGVLTQVAGLQTNVPPLRLRKRLKMKGHRSKVLDMTAAGADAGLLATVGQDNTLIVWDAASGMKTDAIRVPQGYTLSVACPPSGRIATVGGLSCTIDLYSINDRLCELTGESRGVYPIKENHSIYIENEAVKLFGGVVGKKPLLPMEHRQDVPAPSGARPLNRHRQYLGTLFGHGSAITGQTFLGEYTLGSGAADGSIRLWDVLTGEPIMRSYEHLGTISDLATSPQSSCIMASAADDGMLKLWDLRVSRSVLTFEPAEPLPLNVVRFHPEGHSLVAANRSNVAVLDMRSNTAVARVSNFGMPTALSVSDSGRLALLGYAGGNVCALDLLKGVWVSQHRPHRERVSGLAICNGDIMSASWDGTLAAWCPIDRKR